MFTITWDRRVTDTKGTDGISTIRVVVGAVAIAVTSSTDTVAHAINVGSTFVVATEVRDLSSVGSFPGTCWNTDTTLTNIIKIIKILSSTFSAVDA